MRSSLTRWLDSIETAIREEYAQGIRSHEKLDALEKARASVLKTLTSCPYSIAKKDVSKPEKLEHCGISRTWVPDEKLVQQLGQVAANFMFILIELMKRKS